MPRLYVTLRFRWGFVPQLRVGVYIPIFRLNLGHRPKGKERR